ncbi:MULTISPECIES: hypothetical protein [Streptomyces]|uniref:Uncharacterized protein n=2 Tax=Streptomyces TaxID=1883 RepID=A0A2U9NZT6_STRAS|nr:hypothetical protein [Streptomyces actuosus]AWT42544.1 hypothetical protein DMT42_09600 [Streptomyces actuosus]MBM4819747.1 hypothetical protein [Streptomyces actuosus]
MSWWAGIVAVLGTVGAVVAGAFAARATTRAAAATAEATRAAALAQAEPNQRAEDRAAFDAIKKELREELTSTRQEIVRVRGVLYSLSRWALTLRDQVLELGGTPQQTPDDVETYYRTGV